MLSTSGVAVPGPRDAPIKACLIGFLHGLMQKFGIGPDEAQGPQRGRFPQKHVLNDLPEDAFGHPGDPGIIEKEGLIGVPGPQKMVGQVANRWGLLGPGLGLNELATPEQGPGLILPAAAGGEELLQA